MVRPTLFRSRKLLRLVHILNLPRPYVIGLLETLWQKTYETGEPYVGDATDIELAAEWPGEDGEFTQALLSCGGNGNPGFLEPSEDRHGYTIHDYWDHVPDYVRKRRRREEERKVWAKRKKRKPADKKKDPEIPFEEIVAYLNSRTGKKYSHTTESNKRYIRARWTEGARLMHFKLAIDNQCREWKGTEMAMYLRPSTLFNAEKFEGYVNNIDGGGDETSEEAKGKRREFFKGG